MASFREFRGIEAWGADSWKGLCKVKESGLLIQCITNYVSMDIMANTLLAAGASPAMVHAVEEIPEFTALADALVVNLGTLSSEWAFSMKVAAIRATELSKPWVLDIVGAGSTRFRNEKCLELMGLRPAVIRGNSAEIVSIVQASVDPSKKGDAHPITDALEAAKQLARTYQTIVAVSGAGYLVTDGKKVLNVSNGVALTQRIASSGCAATSLVAAFVAVHPGRLIEATAYALALFGLAAEIGIEKSNGPASLRVNLLDALQLLEEGPVTSRIRIDQI